jgi:hypothetical protein
MAQIVNSFGFQTKNVTDTDTNTNIANADLTQDADRTLTGGSNKLTFTGQTDIETNSALSFKNGTSSPDIRLYEASGSGTNYLKLTCNAIASNTTITFPVDTSTTLAGLALNQTFTGKNTIETRQFNITSSTAGDCDGDVVFFGSGSVVVGRGYYWDGSIDTWAYWDASAASTGSGLLGIALGTGTASSVGMCIRGMVTMSTDEGDAGDVLYMSEAAGKGTDTAPSTSGAIVRCLGYFMDDSDKSVFFNPDGTWVENA